MKSRKQTYLQAKSLLRQRRREIKVRRKLNLRRSRRKRVKYHRQRNSQTYQDVMPLEMSFDVPTIFSINANVDGVMSFINYVYASVSREHGSKIVNFNLSNVITIDNEAISILLALINTITRKRCFVKGDSPIEERAQAIFADSGFFEHVQILQGHIPSRANEMNLMIEAGTDHTKNKLVGMEIRKAMKELTGTYRPYQPVYSVIQEICGNSVEHANETTVNKNWLISVFYGKKCVTFTMVDIGKGILGTLRKKTSQKVKDFVQFRNEVETLRGAFTRRYQSNTWEINRNKGLPKINDYQEKGYISNLRVVSNNVMLDFGGSASHQLKTNFRGTFYTWTLTVEDIHKWNTRIK